MSNVQLEHGYSPIANEILNQIVRLPLNGTQFRIIMVVWRYTYGFSRKEHDISIGFLLNALGLKESQYRQISRELGKLLEMGLLVETEKPNKNKSRRLMFQKDFDKWTKKSTGLINPVDKTVQTIRTNKSREPLDESVHQDKQNVKTRSTSKDIEVFFEVLWSMYPRKEGKAYVSQVTKAKLLKIGFDEMTRALKRYEAKITAEGTERKYIKSGSSFFNKGYVDYLDANFNAVDTVTKNLEGVQW